MQKNQTPLAGGAGMEISVEQQVHNIASISSPQLQNCDTCAHLLTLSQRPRCRWTGENVGNGLAQVDCFGYSPIGRGDV